MTRALVTGVPGWLGSRLVERLVDAGRPVRVLTHGARASSPSAADVETVEGDLTDAASLEPFVRGAEGGTLFHAAGVIHPTRGVKQFYAVNDRGTRQLLDAAIGAGVRRFVHVSSNSPIGTNPTREHLFDEDAPYNPYMHYGRSKKLGEDHVNAAGASRRIETVIIRPPWFYGPGQPERQARFFRMIRDGQVPIVGDGGNVRSMAYVDNICQGLMLCESVARANGRTYWIADRRPYTMNEIVDTIESVLEQDFAIRVAHKRRHLPAVVSDVALLADKVIQGAGFYVPEVHVLSEMSRSIACSIDRARTELGYEPAIELREGMRRSIEWMLANGQPL